MDARLSVRDRTIWLNLKKFPFQKIERHKWWGVPVFQLVGKLDGPHGIQVSIFENEFKIWWYYWTSTTEHDQNEFDLISIRLKPPLIDHCPFSGESVGPNFSKKKIQIVFNCWTNSHEIKRSDYLKALLIKTNRLWMLS